MRQVLQSLHDGTTMLAEVPAPQLLPGGVLVRTTCSLISAGTERMLVEFGRAGWLGRARQQPERVAQVLDKVRTDGLLATVDAVRRKLDQPLPMGYCNVGVVREVGAQVCELVTGDRVVSNGPHAEWVAVPQRLCARVPDEVADDEAVFAVLGAVALQGVRLAAPTLGESFAVTGLGLLGLLTVQLLRANGCRVLGIDPDPSRRELARGFGADVVALDRGEEALAVSDSFSRRLGMDGVIVTAATTSNEPVTQAARMCRKRGRIVLVGVAGLNLERADFYDKELSLQVSCSYGPGRYDPDYEERGQDYPLGYVRWTAQRNFQAALELMRTRQLDVRPLISHRFAFETAPMAYELLAAGAEPHTGILLEYPRGLAAAAPLQTVAVAASRRATLGARPGIACLGAGNYAARVLIPAFAAAGVRMVGIASLGGVSAAQCARRFGFARATTDAESLLAAADVEAVVIATRHDSHAVLASQALRAGKHVFVEKPLALTATQLDALVAAWEEAGSHDPRPHLVVGFNRRFAPQVLRMRSLLAAVREPKALVATVNAGVIGATHWTQDRTVGGGRIIGEACHFVDLLRCLAGHPIIDARIEYLGAGGSKQRDSAMITLRFADGSIGSINYLANGHRSWPKERIEIFCAGRVLQLDNFRTLRAHGWPGPGALKLWRQDKGHGALVRAFVSAIRCGGPAPIPVAELIEVSRVVIALGEAAQR